MTINNPTYDKSLYEPEEIKKLYKDEQALDNLSDDELQIVIRTIEYEIQKVTSYKGLFLSTLSIVIALILVIVTSDDMNIMLTIALVSTYLIIMITYFFITAHGITNLYKHLNKIRYVRANKNT
ncbi:hypothetical protein [Lysinibacillus fusiformis]|uniref:hypothetical protein n=1 Tax=Lysinibacillus fusiformis TaxID=28031 RepID=UPI003D038593